MLDWIGFSKRMIGVLRVVAASCRRLGMAAALVAIAVPGSAFAQEISGPCAQVVGTYLTTNTLADKDGSPTSRSLLALTNGGHAIRFDSDEQRAAADRRAFGDSLGTWRCDGVDDDGTVHLTTAMLDFTFPGSEGKSAQIVRLDLAGRYVPAAATLELEGEINFLPKNANAQDPASVSRDISPGIAISMHGKKIGLPAPQR